MAALPYSGLGRVSGLVRLGGGRLGGLAGAGLRGRAAGRFRRVDLLADAQQLD
ncbi:hypothetical protein D9M69_736140 [compost metagenome]